MDDVPREFRVTVKMTREYSASITVRAADQVEAARMALVRFGHDFNSAHGVILNLPPPWDEHECHDGDPEIDTLSSRGVYGPLEGP